MVRFERPPGPPNVWNVVDGFEVLEDGTKKPVKYSIQEVPNTPKRRQEVIDLMCNHYLNGEPMAKCLKLKDDLDAVNHCKAVWNYTMDHNISVGCYKLNSEGEIEGLVGANIVYIMTDETKNDLVKMKADFKSTNFLKMWNLTEYISKKGDVEKMYNVNKYVASASLCVDSTYRGQKLGFYMLDARREIGKKYDCSATSSIFSILAAQKQAERAGFEERLTIEYKDAVDDEGNLLFPNIEDNWVKLMMRRLP